MAPEGDLERKLVCFYEYIFPGSNRVLCEVINWVVHGEVLGIVHGVEVSVFTQPIRYGVSVRLTNESRLMHQS